VKNLALVLSRVEFPSNYMVMMFCSVVGIPQTAAACRW